MQAEVHLPPDLLCVVLGPTASGKTELAVALAHQIDGEIISVDSRQVYRDMHIGTGKDLAAYRDILYHLIDICNPGERYHLSRFQADFQQAYRDILARGRQPIACGGTGLYIHSLLQHQPYIDVPLDLVLRETWQQASKEELLRQLDIYQIPANFHVDRTSHKRLIRAIEVLEYLKQDPGYATKEHRHYPHIIFGINPPVEDRRKKISQRLKKRIDQGLVDEVESLLAKGLTHDALQYYGLEYKYVSLFLLGQIDRETFFKRLETEIHRYAKRQMTFFRKMEKDGLKIHWLQAETTSERLKEMLQTLQLEKNI